MSVSNNPIGRFGIGRYVRFGSSDTMHPYIFVKWVWWKSLSIKSLRSVYYGHIKLFQIANSQTYKFAFLRYLVISQVTVRKMLVFIVISLGAACRFLMIRLTWNVCYLSILITEKELRRKKSFFIFKKYKKCITCFFTTIYVVFSYVQQEMKSVFNYFF